MTTSRIDAKGRGRSLYLPKAADHSQGRPGDRVTWHPPRISADGRHMTCSYTITLDPTTRPDLEATA